MLYFGIFPFDPLIDISGRNDEALPAAALTGFTWSSVGLVEHLG